MSTSAEVVVSDQRRLLIATGAIIVLGSLGDFLFWKQSAGTSLGIFFAVIAASLMVTGHRTRSGIVTAVLLLASCVQSAIELCFTNIAALAVLTIVLFGETTYNSLTPKWPRWSEASRSIFIGASRWGNLVWSWADTPWLANKRETEQRASIGRAIRAAAPAAVFALIFAVLLSSGNAILAEAFSRFGSAVKSLLLEISFGRTVMWLIWLTVGVAFLWPAPAPKKPRWWTRTIPQWRRHDERLARWESAMLLGMVNVLFFAANTIDVVYLWSKGQLPAGIGYSQFVHQGVYSLIAAVLLAAGTLTVLFNQQTAVSRNRILRSLAILWIIQNVVLILGVLRRLQFYVEAYQLSELRVYVGCFLALVTIGFVLLGQEIWKGMNLGGLLLKNAIAGFGMFFVLQFCDVGTWVANWNVSRWMTGNHPSIDLEYLASLGPKGWPGLSRVASSNRNPHLATTAQQRLAVIAAFERQRGERDRDWRSYQARRAARRSVLPGNQAPPAVSP